MKESKILFLEHIAYKLRVNSLKMTTAAGSGHVTSALSAADIVAALFFYAMRYEVADYNHPDNDRFILSKGHAAPVLYAAWKEVGVLSEEEIMNYRKVDSLLEGHPTARFSYAEAATGSLGIGLSIGLGMALSTRLSKQQFYTYVLLGDSEMAEGSVWESIEVAAYYKVDNLIAIIDVNRLGQTTQTMDGHNVQRIEEKLKAFGWETFLVNGHNMVALTQALDNARQIRHKPSVIIAYTYKGYGLESIEDKLNYHGKAFSAQQLPELLASLEKRFATAAHAHFEPKHVIPRTTAKPVLPLITMPDPQYTKQSSIATRKAYGEALVALGNRSDEVLSLDAEVKNSTFAELFEKAHPDRFFQCFIAEQNMIGMAIGLTARGFITYSSTFASFLTRAHDQIRMAAIGRAPLRIAGSHCGVSVGQDGPSQMGLEDIALMRALPDSLVCYPSDAVSTYKLVNVMANYHAGISYLRLTRAETPVIYDNTEEFTIGGCKVLRQNIAGDDIVIVAAGITLHEALKAYEILKAQNISASIIDAYCIKPLDSITIESLCNKSNKRLITVEDHFIQGGLGEAVCFALRNSGIRIEVLAVQELSQSGKSEELLALHHINADAIVKTAQKLINMAPKKN